MFKQYRYLCKSCHDLKKLSAFLDIGDDLRFTTKPPAGTAGGIVRSCSLCTRVSDSYYRYVREVKDDALVTCEGKGTQEKFVFLCDSEDEARRVYANLKKRTTVFHCVYLSASRSRLYKKTRGERFVSTVYGVEKTVNIMTKYDHPKYYE